MSAGAVPDSIKDAIYRWVVAGSELAEAQVVWSQEATGGGPSPIGTYIEMRLDGIDTRVSADWVIPRSEGGVRHVRGTRNPTLELRCFAGASTGSLRAEMVLARVTASRRLPSVAKILRAGDVGIGEIGKVRVVNGISLVEVELHITIDVSEPSKKS